MPELVARVKSLGMNSVAVTDHGNLYGAVEFYREATAAGLNPILGYEAYVAPAGRAEREARKRGDAGFHLTLLAKSTTGFKNLVKMASAAYLEGYHYVPRIDKSLLEAHHEGIICLSGCASGEFSEYILKEQMAEATDLARWFHRVFGQDFYVEIQNNGLDIQKHCAEGAIDIANRLGLPLVATCDAHYLTQQDASAHDVLLCINTGRLRSDPNRMRYGSDQFYVRAPEEMYALFPDHADAVKRSQEIADGCSIQLDFKTRHFPAFQLPKKKTAEAYLREICEAGLKERYGESPSAAVKSRLDHELGIITRMGFAGYFLVVWDFVRFARERGIPASARGSGCGAIVSYVLRLSNVCPLEYDLLFERFLDPDRAEAPDIDIDFCQEGREAVIAYVRQKYGEASVAQIATFAMMAAKAALKDVGRVLDIPLERVTALIKLVPARLHVTLDDTLAESPEFRQEYEKDPLVREWVDIARKLEGTNRQAGVHAAGVVIAQGDLTDYVPLQRAVRKGADARGADPVITTQWVMGDIEKVGLLKMDFLGLRTLTVLDNAIRLIAQTRGQTIDLERLPLDDEPTFQLLQKGDAKGVFQFESDGIRELLKRMRPDHIRDIIACTALYRPGPLGGGMVDSYINRKHGREKPTYQHPIMEEVLAETYGVMCIHEDARVAIGDGREVAIKRVRRGDRVHCVDLQSRRVVVKDCHGCGPTRRGDGVRVTLENGYSVVLTADHDVLTWDGYREAGELDPDHDLVAIGHHLRPEPAEWHGLAPWLGADEAVAYLLGFLVGDGCLTTSGVTAATGTRRSHQRFVAWLAKSLPKLRCHEYFHTRSWYVTLSCAELLNDPSRGNRKTRLHDLLESLGMQVRAELKAIPERLFQAPAAVRAAFLAGLFDADGCMATNQKGHGVVFLTSVSERLRQDVRRLCQLEGIAVRLAGPRVYVWGLRSFAAVVAPHLVLKTIRGTVSDGDFVGWVPRSVVTSISLAGNSVRAFCRATGIQRRGLTHDHPFVRTRTARKAGVDLGDVRFLRVRSVEAVTDQQFFGMSVADHHNLVANGIVVKNCYQEQVMRILSRLGGIGLSDAYACIKAISKKKQDVIDARRGDFVKGAVSRGVAQDVAEEIFGQIEFFGGYGFNKSHSAAYALITYQTAYLKANYTPEFMAALLSSEIDDGNKRDILVDHIADARRLGVEVRPPDVNEGDADFAVRDGQIRFGLTAIKGLGRAAAAEIARARSERGPFRDLFDFCERLDLKLVPRAGVERLIKAGGFDSIHPNRAVLYAALPRALQAAGELQQDRKRGQKSFFDVMDSAAGGAADAEALPDGPDWPPSERLKYEKEALDFYFSSHPLAQHADELGRFRSHTVEQLRKVPHGQRVLVGGMLTQVRFMNVKKARNGNTRYVRCKIEDFTGTLESMMWPDEFARFKDEFADDRILFADGTVEQRADEPLLVMTRVFTIDTARKELTKGLVLKLELGQDRPMLPDELAKVLRKTPGPCPVYVQITDAAGKRAVLRAGERFGVNPAEVRLGELEMLLGPGQVMFTGR